MGKSTDEEKIMQRRAVKLHFDSEDMDFMLLMTLANSGAGGAEIGECLSTASRIRERDVESWVTEWTKAGQRLEARAQAAELAHHLVSARGAYLRAHSYYQASVWFIRSHDKRLAENWRSGSSCFQKSAALFDPPIARIEVPFKPFPLHGYFMPAVSGTAKAPTLIFTTGGEGWAESGYFWVGAAGRCRGYNVVAVDLPIHLGGRLDYSEFPFTDHTQAVDAPLNAVIDYTVQRPDVDCDRVALIGFSAGGHFAGRAAMTDSDNRIKALIADSPISDPYRLCKEEFPALLQKAPAFVTNLVGKIAMHQNTTAAVSMDRNCWQFGVSSVSQFLEKMRPSIIEPEKSTARLYA